VEVHRELDGKPLEGSLETRMDRYSRWWHKSNGPVRTEVIPYEDLFVEPFYQLFRQQLLAHEMERAHELEAECARVVYLAPAANTELWNSLTRPSHHAAGRDVRDAWKTMVAQPDRFVALDTTAMLTDPTVTSPEFRQRYGLEHGDGGT
jgi:Restriction Endonuclease associating with ARP